VKTLDQKKMKEVNGGLVPSWDVPSWGILPGSIPCPPWGWGVPFIDCFIYPSTLK
jgi:hypothetical protein